MLIQHVFKAINVHLIEKIAIKDSVNQIVPTKYTRKCYSFINLVYEHFQN